MTKSKEDKTCTLKEVTEIITDETEIVNIFNRYFVEKIKNLKDNIDPEQIVELFHKMNNSYYH